MGDPNNIETVLCLVAFGCLMLVGGFEVDVVRFKVLSRAHFARMRHGYDILSRSGGRVYQLMMQFSHCVLLSALTYAA